MYRATKNLFAVVNVMGHTTVSTTMKYQHQNIDEVAAVASRRVQQGHKKDTISRKKTEPRLPSD
jgi:site-specific recombinase XerC